MNSDFSILDAHKPPCFLAGTQETAGDLLTMAWEGRFVIADWEDRRMEVWLTELAQALGPKLCVPEVWRQVLPQACLMISAAISGGTLQERLREAAAQAPARCWLRLEPVRMRFPLPCPTGCGETLTQDQLEAKLSGIRSFFSESLCCRYAYDLSGGAAMILYDTQETLRQKAAMAKDAGFLGAVMF